MFVWAGRLIGASVALAVVVAAAGFAWFTTRIPTQEVAIDHDADGIVVLTGGALRIADAMELLAAGRGKRLLISGVHPATKFAEIARLTPVNERLLDCCVDLDRSALNTVGNAVQTRRWAEAKGFRSLIVVTSNYHLPRSMAELSRQMPNVALTPFPVVTEKLRVESWWTSPTTLRIVVSEYLKYVLAHVRMQLGVPSETTGLAKGLRGSDGQAAGFVHAPSRTR